MPAIIVTETLGVASWLDKDCRPWNQIRVKFTAYRCAYKLNEGAQTISTHFIPLKRLFGCKAMGISSLSDVSSNSGLLVTVIIMAGVSMASIKRMFDSLLQIVGINSSKPETMEASLGLGSHLARLILIAELGSNTSRSPGTFGNVTECPVCLCRIDGEADQIRKLRCSHIFHKSCIDRWMDYGQQAACPLCRSSILSEERAMKMEQKLTEELLLWFR